MILKQDPRFREERERFRLRFTCEDCGLFDPVAQGCAHGFSTDAHRLARYDDPEARLMFCKEFDLA